LTAADVDRVFVVGTAMAALFEALPETLRAGRWPCPEAVIPALCEFLRAGDVVMVKGSHAARLDRIVERLRASPRN
jgi:UDP-N-acetylmuramoyl-tripeptide--D-alanyl-D-alanine ligase